MGTALNMMKVARRIDARVLDLQEQGWDDLGIFEDMLDDLPDFQRLLRREGKGVMNELYGRFPGLHRYAIIVASVGEKTPA